MVKFSNAFIPVWKLRKGTVVAFEVLDHIRYGFIEDIVMSTTGEISLVVSFNSHNTLISPEKLLWLEI